MTIQNSNYSGTKKGPSPIVNVRIPDSHLSLLRRAADLSGMPLATFIRTAAIKRAAAVSRAAIVGDLAQPENQE